MGVGSAGGLAFASSCRLGEAERRKIYYYFTYPYSALLGRGGRERERERSFEP